MSSQHHFEKTFKRIERIKGFLEIFVRLGIIDRHEKVMLGARRLRNDRRRKKGYKNACLDV